MTKVYRIGDAIAVIATVTAVSPQFEELRVAFGNDMQTVPIPLRLVERVVHAVVQPEDRVSWTGLDMAMHTGTVRAVHRDIDGKSYAWVFPDDDKKKPATIDVRSLERIAL